MALPIGLNRWLVSGTHKPAPLMALPILHQSTSLPTPRPLPRFHHPGTEPCLQLPPAYFTFTGSNPSISRPAHTWDMTPYEVCTLAASSTAGTRTVARSASLHTPFLP